MVARGGTNRAELEPERIELLDLAGVEPVRPVDALEGVAERLLQPPQRAAGRPDRVGRAAPVDAREGAALQRPRARARVRQPLAALGLELAHAPVQPVDVGPAPRL